MRNSHCSKCGEDKCDDGHVYVIELKESALEKKRFAPDFDRDNFKSGITKCFYVGQSGPHTPQCRYNQHVAKREKPRKVFTCRCNKEAVEVPFTPYNKGSTYVREYYKKGGLRPKIYRDYNPVKGDEKKREVVEKELAESLRRQGHAVHSR